jgi:RimJ/RimL family protein N-acetyltransferase
VAPTLETERLRLRPHRVEDLADCAAMWGDAAVTRYIGGKPFTREEVWARLLRYVGHWALLGYGFWAIEEKATGAFVGEVGFADFKREIEPAIGDRPEAGWVLDSRMHSKGYATEALRTALAWADGRFESGRTVCIIHPENAASLRVADKCGYREFCRTTYKGQPAVLFGRPA